VPVVSTRPVTLASGHPPGNQPWCAVMDPQVFAATGPGLRGLHLMQGGMEIPFVTTVSEPISETTEAAVIHGTLLRDDGSLRIFLDMPDRDYTELNFHLRLKDFVATVDIALTDVVIGRYKIFDLSSEHLGRQTTVQIPELHAPWLIATVHVPGKKLTEDDLEGVDVGPDRAAQSLYSDVAKTGNIIKTDHEMIAEFDVPAHVPVRRIEFGVASPNFLRHVRIEAWPLSDPHDVETIEGDISWTSRIQNGIALNDGQTTVPMTLGANLQGPAHMRVIVENDDAGPLPLNDVTLEMREHKLCFDTASDSALTLVEGGDVASPALQTILPEQGWAGARFAVLGAASAMPQASAFVRPVRYRWRRRHTLLVVLALLTLLVAYPLVLSRKKKARG
jgi:hypothetical protein